MPYHLDKMGKPAGSDTGISASLDASYWRRGMATLHVSDDDTAEEVAATKKLGTEVEWK
jgi:hypothetical protein